MIKIERKGDAVNVKLTVNIPNSTPYTYEFNWQCGLNHGDYAAMLAHHMRDTLWNRIKVIREEAYHDGWKDAKAKRVKRTYHSGYLGN